jgi:hypothetical protein
MSKVIAESGPISEIPLLHYTNLNLDYDQVLRVYNLTLQYSKKTGGWGFTTL